MSKRNTLVLTSLAALMIAAAFGCGSDDDPTTPAPAKPLARSGSSGAAGGIWT